MSLRLLKSRNCRFFSVVGCLVLAQGCATLGSGDGNDRVGDSSAGTQLHSPELAFSITVKQPWQIQVKDAILQDQQRTPEKQPSSAAQPAQPSAPLLIASVPDTNTTVPPTIQLNYRKNTDTVTGDAVILLERQLYYLRAAYEQFTYQAEPEQVRTHTHDAACARFTTQSSVEIDGELKKENVMMKLCLIPRGDLMFMIAMAADTALFPQYQPSFDEMLASVRL